MAIRTNEDEVRSIIETDITISLYPFIRAASALVDRVETMDTDDLLTAAQLQDVETWLAAHFYAHRDQLYQSKNTERAGATFQGQTGMGLNSTQYGRTAMTLDVSRGLAKLDAEVGTGGKRKAGMMWLGKPPSTQIAYEDRD